MGSINLDQTKCAEEATLPLKQNNDTLSLQATVSILSFWVEFFTGRHQMNSMKKTIFLLCAIMMILFIAFALNLAEADSTFIPKDFGVTTDSSISNTAKYQVYEKSLKNAFIHNYECLKIVNNNFNFNNDECYLDSKLPHEAFPNNRNSAGAYQSGGGGPIRSDATKLYAIGAIYLVKGKSIPHEAVKFHINNMTTLIYRSSTGKWEKHIAKTIFGAYYPENFSGSSKPASFICDDNNGIVVNYSPSEAGYNFHFWGKRPKRPKRLSGFDIGEYADDVLYAVSYCDIRVIYSKATDLRETFCACTSLDTRYGTNNSIKQISQGRYKYINFYPRRYYSHNLGDNYFYFTNKNLIDNISETIN